MYSSVILSGHETWSLVVRDGNGLGKKTSSEVNSWNQRGELLER